MLDLVAATAAAFGVVFVAELGDKTQLLAANFGSRFTIRQVLAGLTLGYGSASLLAVAIGGVLGARFPQRPIEVVGGSIFIVFGLLALRPENDDAPDHRRAVIRSSVIVTIALAIFVAEIGDKTQLATATLAARSNPVATWLGATAGEVTSGMIGVLAGTLVGDRISAQTLRVGSALLFIAFGSAMIVGWP